jgi:hypothetical protein
VLTRAWRWVQEQSAFLLVLAILLSAFCYLAADQGDWRPATAVIAAAAIVAGLLRLTLPSSRVGQLAVRGRAFDVLCYLVVGGAMLAVDIRLRIGT